MSQKYTRNESVWGVKVMDILFKYRFLELLKIVSLEAFEISNSLQNQIENPIVLERPNNCQRERAPQRRCQPVEHVPAGGEGRRGSMSSGLAGVLRR